MLEEINTGWAGAAQESGHMGWWLVPWWVPKRATQSPDSAQKAAARAGISWQKPESGFPITMIWPADANTSMVGRENVRSSAMSLL